MHILRCTSLLGALLLFYVAEVRSQSSEELTSAEDAIAAEDTFDEVISNENSLRRRRIIAGVDDVRPSMREVCPIEIDPTPELPDMSTPLECARTCDDRQPPKICYYRFEVEYYSSVGSACYYCQPNVTNALCNNCECVPVDGVERPILTVNRMIPGPSIEVCEGDKVVVDVTNHMEGEGLTLHWHGILQKGSQYYDGAAFITQCPIPEQTTFRYQFKAENPGTHFWHAHTGLQKMDGIFGRLVVRQSQKRDVHSNLYDYDLSRHTVIINDWMHELSTARLPGRLRLTKFQDPDAILINGKGRYQDPRSGVSTRAEVEEFHVRRNYRYRFRFVNAFCTVCASILTIEGHNLTVIAADGIPVEPTVVNSIVSVSGERYDFIVNTNKRPGSYWIQLRTIASCNGRAIQQLAVLRYEGTTDASLTRIPMFLYPLPEGTVLSPLDDNCQRLEINGNCISDLESAIPVDGDIFAAEPDARIYLPFSFHQYDLKDLFAPNTFDKFVVAANFRHTTGTVDDISLAFPASPPLYQDVPDSTFCNRTHKPADCDDICVCPHVIELPYHGIIEFIIVDETGVNGLYHPFHLHGYAFNVMGAGIPNNGAGVTVDDIKRMDARGLLPRKMTSPHFKDTVAIPNNGYAIVRFRADNPGYWFYHCHFIYHIATGMGNIFRVGSPSDLPPVPQDMPKCGNFLPPINQ